MSKTNDTQTTFNNDPINVLVEGGSVENESEN